MRKLAWFTLGFAAACGFGAYVYHGPQLLAAAAVALFLAVGMWLACSIRKYFRFPGMLLLGLSAGFLWFFFLDGGALATAASLNEKELPLTLEIRDYSWEGTYGTCADACAEIDGQEFLLRVYLQEDLILLPGDTVTGTFRLRTTTGDADMERTFHAGRGIYLLGYQRGDIQIRQAQTLPGKYYPAYLRLRMNYILNTSFPADAIGFARALLLGDTTDISYKVNSDFQDTGLRHLIAVSGLHISILFSVIYALSGKKRVLSTLLGIPVLVLFAAVAGFTPSVTRACIMQCLMLLSLLAGKEYDSLTALAFSALVMLGLNPLVITSVSFQMSVASILGISLFSVRLRDALLRLLPKGRTAPGKLLTSLASGAGVTLSAMVTTTPLTAFYFGTVSLVSVLANLLVTWVISFVFCGIALVCLLGMISSGAAAAVAWVIAWPIRYILGAAAALSAIPMAAVYTCSPWICVGLAVVYILAGILLLVKKKHGILLCAGILTVCIAALISWIVPLTDECRVTVLDVGQGQSIILQAGGQTFLVDCGGDYPDDAADSAAQMLLSMGVRRLDGIIVTHYDMDHAGGVPLLLERVNTDALYLPAFQDDSEARDALIACRENTVFMTRALKLSFDGGTLSILPPINAQTDNESSLCVLFQTENCDILITGDRDFAGEEELLLHYDIPRLELLIAGHHGSKNATSQALLDATEPQTVIISVGRDNRYGHPSGELLARLEDALCHIYRTDIHGTVIYRG